MNRRSVFKYLFGCFGLLFLPGLFNIKAGIVSYGKDGVIKEKDIVPGNIFMRDDEGFPEVILQCNGQYGIKGEDIRLYMLGGVHGDPLMPYTAGGVITGNDFMLKQRGIGCDVIRKRYENGITGYTSKEMVKVLNFDNYKLVGKIKYKWPSRLEKRLHGTMYLKNPIVSSNVA